MIRNSLSSHARSAPRLMLRYAPTSGAMPLKSFLTAVAPILAREPRVCLEAIKATCTLQEGSFDRGSGRIMVMLKKPKVRVLPRWFLVMGCVGVAPPGEQQQQQQRHVIMQRAPTPHCCFTGR